VRSFNEGAAGTEAGFERALRAPFLGVFDCAGLEGAFDRVAAFALDFLFAMFRELC
jgi:hypothetical protein